MTQTTDIVLGGAGYSIVPGTYKRAGRTADEARPGLWKQVDFVGGQRRAHHLERDRGWNSAGVGPVFGGQGVEPWPHSEAYTDGALSGRTVNKSTRVPNAIAGTAASTARAYYANDRYLYRSAAVPTAAPWTGFNQVYDAGAGNAATDMSLYKDNLAICYGSAKDIQIFDVAAATAAALSAGEKGSVCAGYAGQLLYSNPAAGSQHQLRMTTGGGIDTRMLDSPIVRMALHAGAVIIATRSSLYTLSGRADAATVKWLSDPQPLFTHGLWSSDQDYLFLLSFGGKLYTWLAGEVMEFNPNAGASKQGWKSAGLDGASCNGAAVIRDQLVVCVTNYQGISETWAFDGTGWWLMFTRSVNHHCWPMPVGGCESYDAVCFRDGSSSITYELARLIYRSATENQYATSGAYITSLIDAGDPEAIKTWHEVGASFLTPEPRGNQASVDPVTITLSYSIDGGATFTTVASGAPNNPTVRDLDVAGAIPGGSIESRHIQIKIAWSSVSDWAPTLHALWAVYDNQGPTTRKRRWQFDCYAADASIKRDGSVDPRSGYQLADDLWSAWSSAATLAFRDVDYDHSGHQYAVRVQSIEESIPRTADGSRWGQSVIKLALIEV